jgi:prepilin-type N-terminal cleavage/methylation domain-containing protein
MMNNVTAARRAEAGFTLIELMVTILIIGVLMTVAIPSFYAVRSRSFGSAAKSIRSTAIKTIEVYNVDQGGTYVGANAAALTAIEPTPIFTDAAGTVERAYVHDTSQNGYTIDVLGKDGVTYRAVRAGGGAVVLTPN